MAKFPLLKVMGHRTHFPTTRPGLGLLTFQAPDALQGSLLLLAVCWPWKPCQKRYGIGRATFLGCPCSGGQVAAQSLRVHLFTASAALTTTLCPALLQIFHRMNMAHKATLFWFSRGFTSRNILPVALETNRHCHMGLAFCSGHPF